MEHYLAGEKNEILPFVTAWIELEDIMLSEISQRKTKTVCFHLYVESKEWNKWTNIARQKGLTGTENTLVVAGGQKGWRRNK